MSRRYAKRQRSLWSPINSQTLLPPFLSLTTTATAMSTSTLLIEGSFPELAEELAQYIDNLSEGAGIFASIEEDLNSIREAESQESDEAQSIQKSKDDVLKKIITKATILNAAPERGKTHESGLQVKADPLSQNFLPPITY